MSKKESKKKSLKQIIGYILSGLLIAVFLVVLSLFIAVFVQTAQHKSPTLFGYRFYYILTDSMSPTLNPGDIIISKAINNGDNVDELVNDGDVITFMSNIDGNIQPNTHRVIRDVYYDEKLGGFYLQTKGDNPYASADAPIPVSDVVAVMKGKMPTLSAMYKGITSKWGLIVFLGIPFLLILTFLIYRLVIIIKTPAIKHTDSKNDIEELKKEIARKAVEEYIKKKNDKQQ